MKRATLRCPDNGATGSVVWYPGTDDKSIYASFCAACSIDISESVVFTEDDPSIPKEKAVCVVVNEFLPNNIKIVATIPDLDQPIPQMDSFRDDNNKAEQSPLLGDHNETESDGGEGTTPKGPGDFQGQLLKFNRINAHLANERTYLAWARTVMSILTLVFTLRTEAKDSYNWNWGVVWFVMSCFFLFSANYTWFNGWTRYVRVKEICLTTDLREAEKKMQRDGLGFKRLTWLTYVIAVLMIITTVVYCWYGTVEEVWEFN